MSGNANATPEEGGSPARTRGPRITIVKVILGVSVLLVLVAFLLPAQRRVPEAARRTQCKNNLKQIGLALANYESTYGTLPPAHTVDADGKPLHSWRTLILPFLDYSELYKKIDLSKPWNDPANAEVLKTALPVYCCPATGLERTHTTYMAVVARNSCMQPGGLSSASRITEKKPDAWIVIEVPLDQAVPWMSTDDANENTVLRFGPKSKVAHAGIVHAACVDGHVETISVESKADERRARISIEGNDP